VPGPSKHYSLTRSNGTLSAGFSATGQTFSQLNNAASMGMFHPPNKLVATRNQVLKSLSII